MVQDELNGDVVQAKILDMLTTPSLKEIIGPFPNLQKWFADLTRTWHEHMTMTVITESMDSTCSTKSAYIEELYSNKDFSEETEDPKPTYLMAHLPNTGRKKSFYGTHWEQKSLMHPQLQTICYMAATMLLLKMMNIRATLSHKALQPPKC